MASLLGGNIPYESDRLREQGRNLKQLRQTVLRRNAVCAHEIWVQEELEDAEVIASFLTARRGQKVRFVVPKMGEKERAGRAGGEECEDGALPG